MNWAGSRSGDRRSLVSGASRRTAIADVLFGDYNPGGRLPVTFYKSVDQLPPFTDYSMEGRTYRFFKGEPFPFRLRSELHIIRLPGPAAAAPRTLGRG